jgi:hypothetical protein
MANGEAKRAERSIRRGKLAAGMIKSGASQAAVKSYVAEQGTEESKARTVNRRIGKEAGFSTDPYPDVASFRKNKLGHKNA